MRALIAFPPLQRAVARSPSLSLMLVAGELSGDSHGGPLLAGLKARWPRLRAFGIGGLRLREAGLEAIHDMAELQVHGLLEVLAHLPRLYRILWHLERLLDERRPDALLLIDYPGFNLKLAQAARARGIPVLYYSGPQVWAWRGGRLRTIARTVAHMIVLFPFEAPLYRRAGVSVEFLGHPLVGQAATATEVARLKAQLGGDQSDPLVAVMPGSRPSEVQRNLPTLLQGIRLSQQAGWRARYVIPVAPSIALGLVQDLVREADVPVEAIPDAFLPLLQLADLALVASGTATLQVGMAGIPFVVVYRVAPLSYMLARRFAYVQHFSIVNILAGREVVPELIQERFTPEAVRDTLLALARDPARQERMRQDLAQVTSQLGQPGAYERAATALGAWLRQHAGWPEPTEVGPPLTGAHEAAP